MTVLSAERDTLTIAKPGLKGYELQADAVVWQGGMVCVDSDGYLVAASDAAAHSRVVGVADESVDNTGGADGDLKVRVRSGEIYDFAATSITQAMLSTTMYLVDDQTFDDTETNVIVGVLMEVVSTTRGKVFIPTPGSPSISSVGTAEIEALAVTNPKLAAGGPGFVTGEGGAVTQITSASTGVTLNTPCGQITTVALTTAGGAEEEFVFTNSEIVATDTIVFGTTYAGAGTPVVSVKGMGAGSCSLVITNLDASALDALMVINFAIIKAVAA